MPVDRNPNNVTIDMVVNADPARESIGTLLRRELRRGLFADGGPVGIGPYTTSNERLVPRSVDSELYEQLMPREPSLTETVDRWIEVEGLRDISPRVVLSQHGSVQRPTTLRIRESNRVIDPDFKPNDWEG